MRAGYCYNGRRLSVKNLFQIRSVISRGRGDQKDRRGWWTWEMRFVKARIQITYCKMHFHLKLFFFFIFRHRACFCSRRNKGNKLGKNLVIVGFSLWFFFFFLSCEHRSSDWERQGWQSKKKRKISNFWSGGRENPFNPTAKWIKGNFTAQESTRCGFAS